MDSEAIKLLEAKYWEGLTSTEEDRLLMTLASKPESGLSQDLRYLMTAISEAKSAELEPGFEEAFWKAVDSKPQAKSVQFHMPIAFRYAAAVVMAIGIGALLWYSSGTPTDLDPAVGRSQLSVVDTYDDPQKAFEETKKALLMVSQKFNKGVKPVGEIKRFHDLQMSVSAGVSNETVNTKHSNHETDL